MHFLIGTYTNSDLPADLLGKGLYTVSFDEAVGRFSVPKLVARCVNPSSLAIDRVNNVVFCGREVFAADNPGVSAFRILPDGELSPLTDLNLVGDLPCHVAFSSDACRLASAQYWSGDAAICHSDGNAIKQIDQVHQVGCGPHPTRQQRPHVHCVGFTDQGSALHLADLGTDQLVSHRLDEDGSNSEVQKLSLPAGSGPRHFTINASETLAFLACELSEDVSVLVRDGLGWSHCKTVTAFAKPVHVEGSLAAIRLSPDERHLYVSGRRQSRIACFSTEPCLSYIGDFATGGTCPRDFLITSDGNWVMSANQLSGSVSAMRRDTNTGKLSDSVSFASIPSPVAILEL